MGEIQTRYAVVDVETTTFLKGHPYARRNRLCVVGIRIFGINYVFCIEHGNEPYSDALEAISELLSSVDLIVGFNLKFDLAWLLRYGIKLPDIPIWDCQLAEFIQSHQTIQFPDLDGTVAKYGLGNKSTRIDNNYWSQGIDTGDIPLDELRAYNENDLEISDALYKYQIEHIEPNLLPLVRLHNSDLMVLLSMEYAGIKVAFDQMERARDVATAKLEEIDAGLRRFVPEKFQEIFNPNSGDHLSCLLFGGSIVGKRQVKYDHLYKSGPKAGTTESRNRWEDVECTFERLVEPKDEWKLKKDGFYSTAEEVILQITKPNVLIRLLRERGTLEKLRGTYYEGLQKTYEKHDWENDIIHGQFNQCRVITGRLSSSAPNLQNFPPEMDKFLISRYD